MDWTSNSAMANLYPQQTEDGQGCRQASVSAIGHKQKDYIFIPTESPEKGKTTVLYCTSIAKMHVL